MFHTTSQSVGTLYVHGVVSWHCQQITDICSHLWPENRKRLACHPVVGMVSRSLLARHSSSLSESPDRQRAKGKAKAKPKVKAQAKAKEKAAAKPKGKAKSKKAVVEVPTGCCVVGGRGGRLAHSGFDWEFVLEVHGATPGDGRWAG